MSQKYLGGYLADTTVFNTPASGDPQFNYVTALLHGDGTNGAQNNTFLDSSTNALSITRNGNTTQGTFSPYGTLWSNYFNGSTDYLGVASNAAFTFGTSTDFTIEMWVNTSSTANMCLIDARPSGSAVPWALYTTATTGFPYFYNGTSYTSSVALTLNAWNHVAVSRSAGTLKIFVNGVQGYSAANTSNLTSGALQIGGAFSGAYFTGYISNIRIVNGTGIYTAAFTPPTAPLTAVSGTALLTCQSNRFIDNSTNAFAITINGSPSIQRFSPFNATAAYSTSTIGGSGYFDGTGDYLLTASNAAFTLAGDFTIEGWMYMTAGANDISLFTLGDANASTGIQVYYYNSAIRMYSGATIIASSTVPNFNAWIHVAVVRSGTTVTLYLNGVSNGTATKSTTYSGAFYTGASSVGPGEYMNGSISDIRVVKGTAVYTTTFTPPTAPLTAITNTSYLLSFTNGGIYDNAEMSVFETVGNAQINTSVYKYGTGSLAFDGTGDGLSLKYNPYADMGSGDFTYEWWMNPTSQPSQAGIWVQSPDPSTFGPIWFVYESGIMRLYATTANGSWNIANQAQISGTIATGTWTHFALTRSGGVWRSFVNGTQYWTITNSGSLYVLNTPMYIGIFGDGSRGYNGYLDDFRITKGYARYTANFTPPTAAFPNSYTPEVTTSIVPTSTSAPGIWTLEQAAYYKAQGLWPSPPVTASYLVVAGGGGGGGSVTGGGGGAGGLLSGSNLSLVVGTSYAVTVGAGGSGGVAGQAGFTGSNSVISTVTSNGGGGGGNYTTSVTNSSGTAAGYAKDGGSGGGGSAGPGSNRYGGTATSGQGNNGGTANETSPYLAGGGGGAGTAGAGGTGSGTGTGNGGDGTASSITGSSVTYAGGGGGSKYLSYPAGTGGTGGGGAGSDGSVAPGTGGTNLGGGGGGTERNGSYTTGGSGGSGVVIISASRAAASTTGSPTVTTSGGNTIYKFTSSGTITF